MIAPELSSDAIAPDDRFELLRVPTPVPISGFVLFFTRAGELTSTRSHPRTVAAYAVHPLIGGGVAEWLKAAVC